MSNHNKNNNHNNSNNTNVVSEKKNWKMWLSLALYALLGLALGYAVAKGVLYLVNKPSKGASVVVENNATSTKSVMLTKYNTVLSHNFEGENKGDVSFDYDDTNKVVASQKDSKLFTVNNARGEKVATVYFYFNGGRGATPEEYITETVKKSVPSVSAPVNASYGQSVWTRAESGATEWHLKMTTNKNWLVYVESAKANNAEVSNILKSVDVK